MNLDNVCVVLVEPQGALNIGSVCRAMGNFGVSELRLVNPVAEHLGGEARLMAVKAVGLLEGASLFTSLEDALADCHLAFGTTRRFGKYRDQMLDPPEAAREICTHSDSGKVALVFGREDKGLHTAELGLCQRFLTIPTSDAVPSMNLAQAVAVTLCHVFALKESAGEGGETEPLATGKNLEGMFSHMRKTLQDIAFLDPQNPDHIMHAFRRIFGRAGLNDREVRILHGMLNRIDWTEGQRRRLTEGDDGTD